MKGSRYVAVGLVVAAVAWIASGHLFPHHAADHKADVRPGDAPAQAAFKVAALPAKRVEHSQKLILSGRSEADKKVSITARTGGLLTELKVRRGQSVEKGDVVAVLSDEAREAQVAQARALFDQRKAELEARKKLIDMGSLPKLDLVNLESQFKAAEANLAAAVAERDRGVVRAPWAGVITDVPAEVGGAAFSMAGKEIATLVALDPMLVVVEVSERKLGGVKVGESADVRFVTGQTAKGKIRYVAKSAIATTRTYRVEVQIDNKDRSIPDGITAEVAISLAPVPATRVPRSALTISSQGDIGVRVVGTGSKVEFVPVKVVEDEQSFMWVSGIADDTKVIVRGQDFVREGQAVEVVAEASQQAAEK